MSVEVGVLIAIGSFLIALLTFNYNSRKDLRSQTSTDERKSAILETKVDSVLNIVSDIQVDIRANERQLGSHNERITRLEESQKSMHKRLDRMEGENK